MAYTVSSSDGISLRFNTLAEKQAYDAECRAIDVKHYRLMRERYGVWASNKERYLSLSERLGELDSSFMEHLHKSSP